MSETQGLTELADLKKFIRLRLKEKKMTYKDLANRLKVSEITIKRWLTKSDISLLTFLQIGKALDFDLWTSIQPTYDQKKLEHVYTPKQEKFLIQNPLAAMIFLKLAIGADPKEIQSELKVDERSFFKILKQLDASGFIELQIGGKVQVKVNGPFRARKGGDFLKHYLSRFRKVLLSEISRRYEEKTDIEDELDQDLIIDRPFEMYMTETMMHSLSKDLSKVLFKYRHLSAVEHTQSNKVRPVAGYVGVFQDDIWKKVYLGK